MAKILIIEDDSVFAAVLEDRLHVAGHVVESTPEADRGIELAVAGGVDLVLLKMELPSTPGLEVIQTLRHRAETRSIPIIALSAETKARERVATLRAGADELLSQPVDLEELLIRVGRLLGSREASPALMQGDLGNHPPWELMQFVQQSGKSGELTIRSPQGIGRVEVSAGRVTSARYQKLHGRDALLALLDLKSGHFRLTTDDSEARADDGQESIPIPEVLMASAWLEDELKKRQEHLPETGVPLELTVDRLPELDPELSEIPVARVFERLQRQPGRLFDLIVEIVAAPSKVRLAVAWLVEQGALAPAKKPGEQFMTTTEISSSVVLDMALRNLLSAAKAAGFETNNLPYLLLVEAKVWPHLRQLLESVPGYRQSANLPKLVEQVKLRQGGSATFETEIGSLSLHVQVLSPEVKAQVEGILSLCAGVLLWLEGAEDRELIEGLIERLETTRSATAGVLVTQQPEEQEILDLVAGKQRWRSSGHAPQSLIGVFRLLHPRA